MTSRERILAAIDHQEPDRVPVDFGATPVTGISASVVSKLRRALGLSGPDDPVKVVEPYQMLGEIDDGLREALGIDTVGVGRRDNLFGFENKDWKEWRLFDGTPVLVPADFNTDPEPSGDILMYPAGDKSCPPSGRMPKGGYYFDTIVRQEPIDEETLDPADNLEEFAPIPEDELAEMAAEAERLAIEGDRAVVGSFGGTSFGDIALVPAPFLRHPKGIRDVEEWYISTVIRPDYIEAVFEGQCEIALANLERVAAAVSDHVQIAFITGTDFGTQRGPFCSPGAYRRLYMPFHARVNEWIRGNTSWKSFCHSCGGVEPLIPDIIDAGFDILNPVQCSAEGMAADHLKREYGAHITFWGGGIDTQQVLPFGTPEDVRLHVLEQLRTFAPGGGFVFNAVHNIQARTPVENVLAMSQALKEFAAAGA